MAQAVGELTEQGSPAFEAALPILSQLLKAETADREVRSTAYQLKAARFPNYRDLAGFDFASSEVNEALARQLHRCEFLEDAHNVVLVGGPGTGKTHLATAIGVQARCDAGHGWKRLFESCFQRRCEATSAAPTSY
jgi:DNA replication protein DnaC